MTVSKLEAVNYIIPFESRDNPSNRFRVCFGFSAKGFDITNENRLISEINTNKD